MSEPPTVGFGIDPWTQVYDRIWACLNAAPGFAALVRPGNQVNMQDPNPDRLKRNLQEGDLPEVGIFQDGGTIDLWATASSCFIHAAYSIEIATGDMRPNKGANQVRLAILQALSKADNNFGLPFVVNTRCLSTADNIDNARINRGTLGWSCVLKIAVDMSINRSVLKGIS